MYVIQVDTTTAMLFASKMDQIEATYLERASLPRFQPVPYRTHSSRYRLRSSADTRVKGEVNHVKRPICPTISDGSKVQNQPQHCGPDGQQGNQELGPTLPSNTQCLRHNQPRRWSYSQSESPLHQQRSLRYSGEVDCDLEPDSHSNFDSSTPPPPSDLEALRKTWEQVQVYNNKLLRVSTDIKLYLLSQVTNVDSRQVLCLAPFLVSMRGMC